MKIALEPWAFKPERAFPSDAGLDIKAPFGCVLEGRTSVVIDTETDFIKLGVARQVAAEMGANYYKLKQLSQGDILHIVRNLGI